MGVLFFQKDQRFVIPTGEYVYRGRIGDDGHLLWDAKALREIVVPDADLQRHYAAYKLTVLSRRQTNKYDKAASPAPGQGLSDVEEARLWFCREWDKAQTSLSTEALDKFVRRNEERARAAGIRHMPSAGALRRALNARGELGDRRANNMRTLRGKVARRPHFPPLVEKIIRRYVAWYWAERGRQKGEAFAYVHGMLTFLNEKGEKAGRGELPIPDAETVRARINKAECRETWATKYSIREAADRFDGVGEPIVAHAILEKIVIDSTTADGWCVWRLRSDGTIIPLGRPTLYLAVDVYSRHVVAWFISFEPPSLYGLMGLLKRIVTPQADGIWGKPDTIIVDNDWANISPSFHDACQSAGISIDTAPAATPQAKAVGERAFGSLNTMLFKKLLGGSVKFPGPMMSKLGLDPAKTASLTLDRLDELLRDTFRGHYATKVHDGIGLPPQLVWERGVAQRRPFVKDLAALVANFGQVEMRTLTREGIITKDGLRFYDKEVVGKLLNVLTRDVSHNPRYKRSQAYRVRVIINPEDLTQCVVWDHVNGRPYFLRNIDSEFSKECSSLWEYRLLKRFAKEETLAFQSEADRIKALRILREKIESAAPDLKKEAIKRARALLDKMPPDRPGSVVVHAEAPASHDGRKPVDGDIPTRVAAVARADARVTPGTRRGGRKATEKAKATRAKRAAEASAKNAPTEQAPSMTTPEPPSEAKSTPTGKWDPRSVRNLGWVKSDKGDQ